MFNPLVIREVQTETTTKYHHTHAQLDSKNLDINEKIHEI